MVLTPLTSYEQVIEFLYGRIDYERVHALSCTASDFKLDRMRALLERLGNPHLRIPAVHVAGTKGKGSTCAVLSRVLTAAGYRTGLFISPHIHQFEERMSVDGQSPTPALLLDLVNRLRPIVAEFDRLPGRMQPTYFEIATALAWLDFESRGADIAVLEVGLGGRLDATNLCAPVVTVITNVSRDHCQILGSTVRQIAAEKAGIIKTGIPVVTGSEDPEVLDVIAAIAGQREAPLSRLHHEFDWSLNDAVANTIDVRTSAGDWSELPVPLRGSHQRQNLAVAVAAIEVLQSAGYAIDPTAVRSGLRAVQWPARIEVLQQHPTVVVDAAHNWASIQALLATVSAEFPARRRVLIFAATRDKDLPGLLRQLVPAFDTVILTRYHDNPRGVPIEEIREWVTAVSSVPVHEAADPGTAWRLAQRLAAPDDLVVATGSFFLAAEFRELFRRDNGTSDAEA